MKTNSILSLQISSLAAGALLSWMTPLKATVVEKDGPAVDLVDDKATITATGTVFSMEPEVLSVVMKGNPTPVRFAYDKSTPFLDELGAIVPLDLIRPDLPLTVHYAMEGSRMVARKVVLTRNMIAGDAGEQPEKKRKELSEAKALEAMRGAEAKLTGPQTMMGTVTTLEQTISLVLQGETQPVSCIINNSTRYSNLSGQPVSSALVASGMPITVKAVRDGSRLIAQEIIVRGHPADLALPHTGALAGAPSDVPVPGTDGLKGTPLVPVKPEGAPATLSPK